MAYYRCTGNSGGSLKLRTVQGDICTFETTLAEPLQSVLVNVLATGGNGTPDNPNPIVGYTGVNLTRCGVNLFGGTLYEGAFISADFSLSAPNVTQRSLKIFLDIGTYTISFGGTNSMRIFRRLIDGGYDTNRIENIFSYTFTTTIAGFVGLSFRREDNNAWEDINIQVAKGTDTTYHAYTGNAYTIAFGQTVYGGTLDVTRGKLNDTWGDVDLGSLSWTHRTDVAQGVFAAQLLDYKFSSDVQAKCDIYAFGGSTVASGVPSKGNNTVSFYYDTQQTARYVYVYNTSYSDASTFTTAMSGHKLAYELATPFDIDLGSGTAVTARAGVNNVFADCGQTELKYLTLE